MIFHHVKQSIDFVCLSTETLMFDWLTVNSPSFWCFLEVGNWKSECDSNCMFLQKISDCKQNVFYGLVITMGRHLTYWELSLKDYRAFMGTNDYIVTTTARLLGDGKWRNIQFWISYSLTRFCQYHGTRGWGLVSNLRLNKFNLSNIMKRVGNILFLMHF